MDGKFARNFTLDEFIYGTRNDANVELIDMILVEWDRNEDLWVSGLHRIANRLQVIRDYFDRPVVIKGGGGIRTYSWEIIKNRSGKSRHVLGDAADFFVDGALLEDVYAFVNETFKTGGRALSIPMNFIHLDDRGGPAVTWTY